MCFGDYCEVDGSSVKMKWATDLGILRSNHLVRRWRSRRLISRSIASRSIGERSSNLSSTSSTRARVPRSILETKFFRMGRRSWTVPMFGRLLWFVPVHEARGVIVVDPVTRRSFPKWLNMAPSGGSAAWPFFLRNHPPGGSSSTGRKRLLSSPSKRVSASVMNSFNPASTWGSLT